LVKKSSASESNANNLPSVLGISLLGLREGNDAEGYGGKFDGDPVARE
jgi:hypothetical protein